MDAVKVISSDVDFFLIEQFQAIKHERKYVLPSEYTEKVRYVDKELTPFQLENKNNEWHPTFMNHDIITNDEIKEDCVFTGIKNEF